MAGIDTGSLAVHIKKQFGTPINIKKYERSNGWIEEEWEYDGLIFSIGQGHLSLVTVNSPKYPTYRGLKVGDSISKIKELYPDAQEWTEHKKYVYEVWTVVESGAFISTLEFEYDSNNVIIKIASSSFLD